MGIFGSNKEKAECGTKENPHKWGNPVDQNSSNDYTYTCTKCGATDTATIGFPPPPTY